MIISKSIPIACILSTLVLLSVARSSEASSVISSPDHKKEESGSKIGGRRSLKKKKGLNKVEIWASDQSNSVSNQEAAGVNGSYLWIWGSDESSQHPLLDQIKDQDALKLLACSPDKDHGPCDLWDVFPSSLEHGTIAETTLGQLNGFGRLHGMLKDPQNLYINVNIFAPGKKMHKKSYLFISLEWNRFLLFFFWNTSRWRLRWSYRCENQGGSGIVPSYSVQKWQCCIW